MAATEPRALAQLGLAGRFFLDLRRFLKEPITPEQCRARVREGLRARADNFLLVLERAVYARPGSPYQRLLAHAGVTLDDVRELVRREGLEATLERLHDAGVCIRLEEFKGRAPVRRGSLTFEVRSHDFDNPLAARHFAAETGGSRGAPTRIYVDLEHYTRDAVYDHLFLEAFALVDRPYALWRPPPPWGAGIKAVFTHVKAGHRVARWFAHNRVPFDRRGWKHGVLTWAAILGSRIFGRPMPAPEHVPLAEAGRIAEWLAAMAQSGRPVLLNTNAASAVRACLAAKERGLDIQGTVFRTGGEPLTEAKVRVIQAAGCRVATHYSMGETGRIGLACAAPREPDDTHILLDKLALITRDRPTAVGTTVPINVYTTLLPFAPKLLLNFESDDYGDLVRRSCGCLLDRLGYGLHFANIRSRDKLTSEGMTFIGNDLVRLLEEVLPQRFGGHPADYQLVERETETGLPQVELVVSPRVGWLDEGAVVAAVINFLNRIPNASDAYGERWRQAGTLRLVRAEPHATGAGKILALHVAHPPAKRLA